MGAVRYQESKHWIKFVHTQSEFEGYIFGRLNRGMPRTVGSHTPPLASWLDHFASCRHFSASETAYTFRYSCALSTIIYFLIL